MIVSGHALLLTLTLHWFWQSNWLNIRPYCAILLFPASNER